MRTDELSQAGKMWKSIVLVLSRISC